MLRWRKWRKRKQPLPIQKLVTTLAPTPLIQLPFLSLMQRGQGTREHWLSSSDSHLHLRRLVETMTACLDYGLPGRGTEAPQREGAFSSLCPFLTWTVTCQGSATLKTHGQVPGFREPTAFLHMVKTSAAAALAWQLRLDSRGGKNTTCKCTHSHSRALPSLVPLCTETLKSQLVLTLHITSIVFQREAIHGIKTSTGSSFTRTTKLQAVRSGHDCA